MPLVGGISTNERTVITRSLPASYCCCWNWWEVTRSSPALSSTFSDEQFVSETTLFTFEDVWVVNSTTRKIERHYLMSIIDSFLSMEATLMPSWWISTPESAPLCVEVVDTSWYNDRLIDNNRSQNPGWNRSAVLGNLEWGLNQVLHPDLCIEKVRLEVKSSNLGFQDTPVLYSLTIKIHSTSCHLVI